MCNAAHNLNCRTNNGFWEDFSVNPVNELTSMSRSTTNLTVAGTTTMPATNVTVSGTGVPSPGTASLYADPVESGARPTERDSERPVHSAGTR